MQIELTRALIQVRITQISFWRAWENILIMRLF